MARFLWWLRVAAIGGVCVPRNTGAVAARLLRSGPCRLGEEVLATAAPVRRRSSLRDPMRRAWKLVDEDPDSARWVSALGAVCVARGRICERRNATSADRRPAQNGPSVAPHFYVHLSQDRALGSCPIGDRSLDGPGPECLARSLIQVRLGCRSSSETAPRWINGDDVRAGDVCDWREPESRG